MGLVLFRIMKNLLLLNINLPLQYLGIHSCGLTDNDLNYLSTSKHSIVENLDLSENRLTRYTESLIHLLKNCSLSLQAIELDDNFCFYIENCLH